MQPAQTQDQNADGLVFFSSLQSDVSFVAKGNHRDLLEAVVECLGGLSWRVNAKRVDVLVRLVSRHNGLPGGRGLEQLNTVGTDSYTALDKEDVANVQRRIITTGDRNLNEMRAEAATVGDAESVSSGDNDMSDEDSKKTQSHSSELLFSLCIACKQVRQCHECYSE